MRNERDRHASVAVVDHLRSRTYGGAASLRRTLAVGLSTLAIGCGSDPTAPNEPGPVRVTITPTTTTLLVQAALRFSTTVTGTDNTGVTFSVVEGPAGGTVNPSGEYTAPGTPGTFRVRATSSADPSRFAEAVVTVRDYRGQFERVGDPSGAYDHHTATLLNDGSVLVVGGRGFGGVNPQSDRYLPERKVFEPGPALTTGRMNHAAILLADGRLLVTGGWDLGDAQSPFDPAFASTEIYDPATARFEPGPDMTRPRRNHVLTFLATGRVLVTGGIQLRGTGFSATPDAELFDPVSNTFTASSPMATGRWLHTATLLADGRVLVAGGRDNNCTVDCEWHSLASAEIFDPATESFSPTGSLNFSRFGHSAALLADGRVAVFGGTTTESLGETDQVTAVEVFDPASETFSVLGATLMGRSYHALVQLNNGNYLLAGGLNQNGSPTASSEVFDPNSGSSPGPEMTDWRIRAAAVKLRTGEVLVVGGNNSGAAVLPVDLFR